MKLSKKEVERRERLRQDETRRELEKVKKRKIVRRLCGVLAGIAFAWRCCGRRERGRRRERENTFTIARDSYH